MQIQASCLLSPKTKVTCLAWPCPLKSPDGTDLDGVSWVLSFLDPIQPVLLLPSESFKFLKSPALLFILSEAANWFRWPVVGEINWRGGINNPFLSQISRSGSLTMMPF